MTDQEEINDTPTKLRNKQLAFCEAYLRLWNATQAALEAGYSPKTSYSIGQENLKKPEIQVYLKRRLSEVTMSADEVLQRLADQARASLLPFIEVSDDGFVYFDFSHPDAKKYMHLIKKIKTKRERRIDGKGESAQEWEGEWVEVELYDAQNALITLAKHHSLFSDHTINMNVDLNSMTDDQLERIAKGENVITVLASGAKSES